MKSSVALLLLFSLAALAGTTALPRAVPGLIRLRYVNAIQAALSGTVVPRNSAGTANDISGGLGTNLIRWNIFRGQTVTFLGSTTGNPVNIHPGFSQTTGITLTMPSSLPLGTTTLTIDPLGNLNFQGGNYISSSGLSGNFSTQATGDGVATFGALITNMDLSIETSGNPLNVRMVSGSTVFHDYGVNSGHISGSVGLTPAEANGAFFLLIDGVAAGVFPITDSDNPNSKFWPCSRVNMIVQLSSGTHSVQMYAAVTLDPTNRTVVAVTDCKLVAYEIF